jgi:hypothetical protein
MHNIVATMKNVHLNVDCSKVQVRYPSQKIGMMGTGTATVQQMNAGTDNARTG